MLQSGIGEALAAHFVSKGWRIACVDIQRGPGEALAVSLGPNAHFWETNVADYDSQARMFQGVFEKWGRVDALLANAGIVDRSSIYILNHRGNDTYVDPCKLCLNRVEKVPVYHQPQIWPALMSTTKQSYMELNLRFIS